MVQFSQYIYEHDECHYYYIIDMIICLMQQPCKSYCSDSSNHYCQKACDQKITDPQVHLRLT